jgi:hypothetical protein
MNTWDNNRVAAACEAQLGMRVRQEFDLEVVQGILERIGKEFVSPILDPTKNDFTPANSFWLIAERDGVPQMIGGVRCDDLRSMDVRVYWERMLSRVFNQSARAGVKAFPPDAIAGKIAYFGDLYSIGGRGMDKAGREKFRLFTAIGHYLTQQEFAPNVTYCFVQDRDMARGTPSLYGFLDLWPFFYEWQADPYPSGVPEWVGCLPREKLPLLMEAMQRVIAAKAHNKSE